MGEAEPVTARVIGVIVLAIRFREGVAAVGFLVIAVALVLTARGGSTSDTAPSPRTEVMSLRRGAGLTAGPTSESVYGPTIRPSTTGPTGEWAVT